MTDAMNAAATPQAPTAIQRLDYRAPDWLVPDIALDFDLDPKQTTVIARLHVRRNGTHDRPLVLDGDGLAPLVVHVDGEPISDWRIENHQLIVPLPGDNHLITTEVAIQPDQNTQLMGLYASGGLLCTQCEAEGFRRITFFPDRPDVLSRYKVKMAADRETYPILLANGDPIASGDAGQGRHWAEWHDPHPKPCYLFALVAGDLQANSDHFTTSEGRHVALNIWVKASDVPRTAHAMAALKASMKWDEEVYGRAYDLDVFNIVAVDDFNFGAMENKGLNVFNARYILADPDTATDLDFDNVEGVVAHEYFHNWSGNRVTCRDWFQLSLKEGFTVFRDQNFSADQGSPAVKRIDDVRNLRAGQFPEDAGPLAHPIRPDSYIEIANFYTATIYNKGAEVIRMMHTVLGQDKFRKGSDLYFARHDGEAATCDQFVAALADGSGVNLDAFHRWYEQAGTPRVTARLEQLGDGVTLHLEQSMQPTPGQPIKQPMPIPLKVKLFEQADGRAIGEEQLVLLDTPRQSVKLATKADAPVLSINRHFSAPVVIESDRSAEALMTLAAHDDDPFSRYEAMQQLMVKTLLADMRGEAPMLDPVITAVRRTLGLADHDHAFAAEAVLLPSEAFLGDQMEQVDPVAIRRSRDRLRAVLGKQLRTEWEQTYAAAAPGASFSLDRIAKGKRRLRNVVLGYLVAGDETTGAHVAWDQFQQADNMTARQGALTALVNSNAPQRTAALDSFYQRYQGDNLVIDKWFTAQAFSTREDVIEQVRALAAHPDFTLHNPNRMRALVGAFAGNQYAFHDGSGDGYAFVTDMILATDPINPQVAARLVPPLGRWRRFDPARAALMKAALERIVATPGMSKDVLEQASKSLA
jgi:aminopeptidase N